MITIFNRIFRLSKTQTAKDTYTLFGGNVISAFLGFFFTLIIARALSVEDFGIFSAAINLIVIIASVTDLGMSSGLINFVSSSLAKGERDKADQYIKASFVIRFISVFFLSFLIIVFAPFVSKQFLATSNPTISYWVAINAIGLVLWIFFPYILQAQKKFFKSVVVDLSMGVTKTLIVFVLFTLGYLNVNWALGLHPISNVVGVIVGLAFVGTSFIRAKPSKNIYKNLMRFSGWIGVNRIISAISGRLDIQMLAALVGATATGLYSIPSKLASFIIVLTSSYSSVLAPRLAGFDSKEKEKIYIKKATLGILPFIVGVLVWIVVAKPFITTLFGNKYIDSVPIFKMLAAAMIPYMMTAPSVTAIIYAMKKTVYIGAFSFFQIASIFTLNFLLIPKYGAIGPTITFAVVYTILAIYTWTIVIRYYWIKK